jgi:adenine-specific DNA-methyltransferase
MYGNPDDDPRGDWRPDNLTCPKDFYKERPNLYYPVIDPKTGIAYPSNPDRVWVYAQYPPCKKVRLVQTKTMEEFIESARSFSPSRAARRNLADDGGFCSPRLMRSTCQKAEKPRCCAATCPIWNSGSAARWLWSPQFKRYKADLRNQTQPLSSWVVPSFEAGDYEAAGSFVAGTNQEGARVVAEIFGDRAFNYAKPLSLIKNLLQQATRPGDIVLDFFAGSGTTGHAVLELNAEDQGQRSFILCSSTEATKKEPAKNLCRDVCAERIRRVMQGYGGKPALGGEFAYLQLDKVEVPDLPFEADAAHAFQLLALRRFGEARPLPAGPVKRLGQSGDCAVLLCERVDAETIASLVDWRAQNGVARLAIYSPRPSTLAEQLAAAGVEANCYSLLDAVMRGQVGGGANE